MPANLPPQYFTLSAELKKAKTTQEKISVLEEMLAIVPKHKGTEKVQKDLKRKIAKFKKEAQSKKKSKKELIYTVKREGAAQVVISGSPNSGKSTLLNALTNANAKIADYPFTTTLPQPAMMAYENILIQLIDTPPLTKDFHPGWLKEILRNSDGIVAVFDLSKENFEKEIEKFKEILKKLNIENPEGKQVSNGAGKKILFIGNKIDLLPQEKIKEIPSLYIKKISALKKIGLEDLKREIFEMLEIIRVYSKGLNKEPDFEHPFTFKKGTRLLELAQDIHYDFASKFKYARLFKKNSKKSSIVGKDYVLEDGDVVEIHT